MLQGSYTIRDAREDDLDFLWEMLWEAASVSDEMRALGRLAALEIPEISRYLDGWGRAGDSGFVATGKADQRLGAAWIRFFPEDASGYGFVAADVPELSIAVAPGSRNQGVGSALLERLMETARSQGHRAISLAVDSRNLARLLYASHGFQIVSERSSDEVLTMIVLL